MSDAPKPPPLPRPGTHGEIRRRTPPQGYPVAVDEDVTGQYEGEELDAVRARRPTPDRFRVLERKSDGFDVRLGTLEVTVGRIDERTSTTADQVAQLVEIEQTKRLEGLRLKTAEAEDAIAKRRSTRELAARVVGWAITGGGIVEILHWIARHSW